MERAAAAVVALGLLLAGCAPHMQLSADQRRAVKAVRVAPTVPIPDKPLVQGSDSSMGFFLLGPLGMAVASATSDQHQQFKDFLVSRGVDVSAILRDEFIVQTRATPGFPQVVDEGGDAVVQLEIDQYGLAPGFSLRPIDKPLSATLRVTARMTNAEGNVLWQKVDFVTNMNAETESHRLDVWLGDKAIAEKGFRKAAEIVVKGLLAEFRP